MDVNEINRLHDEMSAALSGTVQDAIRVGELLWMHKGRISHGGWQRWVKTNIDFNYRSVRRYMRVYHYRREILLKGISSVNQAEIFLRKSRGIGRIDDPDCTDPAGPAQDQESKHDTINNNITQRSPHHKTTQPSDLSPTAYRWLREKTLHISQQKLANLLGIDIRTVQRREAGDIPISHEAGCAIRSFSSNTRNPNTGDLKMDHLAILSQTIAEHAHKAAREEWNGEHGPLWNQILRNAGLSGSTLEVDGRSVPIEVITQALREQFLKYRVAQLLPKLTHTVVEIAFRKVISEEDTHHHD